jgi:hypothetical protein
VYHVTIQGAAAAITTVQLLDGGASGPLRWQATIPAATSQVFDFGDSPIYFAYAPWVTQTNPGVVTVGYVQLGAAGS